MAVAVELGTASEHGLFLRSGSSAICNLSQTHVDVFPTPPRAHIRIELSHVTCNERSLHTSAPSLPPSLPPCVPAPTEAGRSAISTGVPQPTHHDREPLGDGVWWGRRPNRDGIVAAARGARRGGSSSILFCFACNSTCHHVLSEETCMGLDHSPQPLTYAGVVS